MKVTTYILKNKNTQTRQERIEKVTLDAKEAAKWVDGSNDLFFHSIEKHSLDLTKQLILKSN